MAKKNARNTRGKIVNAAWKLFYEQGYEDTTVEEIIDLSGTSKGSFYHYFDGKDALLSTLSSLFDEKYEELMPQLTPEMSAIDQLLFLNQELFRMIENSISLDLLARLYSTQLTTSGMKNICWIITGSTISFFERLSQKGRLTVNSASVPMSMRW